MHATYLQTIHKYDEYRKQARELASRILPGHLKDKIILSAVDFKALAAFKAIDAAEERVVDWDWNFSSRYCSRYPKAFDLSVWHGNRLCSLTLGRPTYKGTAIRLDFIEKFNKDTLFSGDMFPVSLLAYEAYGKLIGASQLRIMEPENDKLIKYYSSHGGFDFQRSMKGNPHYLVKNI